MTKAQYYLAVGIALVLFSCSPRSSLVSSWSSSNALQTHYKKVGVMVLTPNNLYRLEGEEDLVNNFKLHHIPAHATLDLFPLEKALEVDRSDTIYAAKIKQEMTQTIKTNEFDALMIVAVFDKEKEIQYNQGYVGGQYYDYGYYDYGSYYGNNYYGNTVPYAGHGYAGMGYGSYYTYSTGAYYEPGYYTEEVMYYVEFTLYDVATGKILWVGQTKTIDLDRHEEEIERLAKIVVDEIVSKGVLSPKMVE